MLQRRRLAFSLAWAAAAPAALGLGACRPQDRLPDAGYTLLDGSVHRLGEGPDRVRLIHFWSTGCAICMQEMGEVMRLHEAFASAPFELLAISMSYDAPAVVDDVARRRRLPFPVAIDITGELAARLGPVEGTPTWLLADASRQVTWRFVGRPEFPDLHRRIARLLAPGAGQTTPAPSA